MLIHDIIKIKYVSLGYIRKNYPYHLISDEEMFNAFIDLGNGFESSLVDNNTRFFDMCYPNPFEDADYIYEKKNKNGEVRYSLSEEYSKLRAYIVSCIKDYLKYADTQYTYELPDWIYTYMLGEVVYKESEYLDIQDTLALLDCSNIDNEFTREACIKCYITSLQYISTLTVGIRPPTIFGEPHVIKQLRLET